MAGAPECLRASSGMRARDHPATPSASPGAGAPDTHQAPRTCLLSAARPAACLGAEHRAASAARRAMVGHGTCATLDLRPSRCCQPAGARPGQLSGRCRARDADQCPGIAARCSDPRARAGGNAGLREQLPRRCRHSYCSDFSGVVVPSVGPNREQRCLYKVSRHGCASCTVAWCCACRAARSSRTPHTVLRIHWIACLCRRSRSRRDSCLRWCW
jgi:hypothetical protein